MLLTGNACNQQHLYSIRNPMWRWRRQHKLYRSLQFEFFSWTVPATRKAHGMDSYPTRCMENSGKVNGFFCFSHFRSKHTVKSPTNIRENVEIIHLEVLNLLFCISLVFFLYLLDFYIPFIFLVLSSSSSFFFSLFYSSTRPLLILFLLHYLPQLQPFIFSLFSFLSF
jgi:hypothetical protein